jgi:hypothetical protein
MESERGSLYTHGQALQLALNETLKTTSIKEAILSFLVRNGAGHQRLRFGFQRPRPGADRRGAPER